mmetsp:Transcript_102640/g.178062  ORF Transcript_102640/g.178062 Transcript_102640/m.178062 type:complete len:202 (+) Transcript_102640:615-1220(+)
MQMIFKFMCTPITSMAFELSSFEDFTAMQQSSGISTFFGSSYPPLESAQFASLYPSKAGVSREEADVMSMKELGIDCIGTAVPTFCNQEVTPTKLLIGRCHFSNTALSGLCAASGKPSANLTASSTLRFTSLSDLSTDFRASLRTSVCVSLRTKLMDLFAERAKIATPPAGWALATGASPSTMAASAEMQTTKSIRVHTTR